MAQRDSSLRLTQGELFFAEQIKYLREARLWSQEELAAALRQKDLPHVNQSTVSRIENQTRPVRLMEAQALAQIFGRTLHSLTNADSRERQLSNAQTELELAEGIYENFVSAVYAMAWSQSATASQREALLRTFGSGDELDPDAQDRYFQLLGDLEKYGEIRILKEAGDQVQAAKTKFAQGPPGAPPVNKIRGHDGV
jgi:transcriptional regulator with XRE-family HTH domain